MLDPTVPKLQEARARLAAMVAAGEISQAEASHAIGKLADGFRVEQENNTRRVAKNRAFAARYGTDSTLAGIAVEG